MIAIAAPPTTVCRGRWRNARALLSEMPASTLVTLAAAVRVPGHGLNA
jgi:hypothetical protein